MTQRFIPPKIDPPPTDQVFHLYDGTHIYDEAFIRRFRTYIPVKESMRLSRCSFYPNKSLNQAFANKISTFKRPEGVHFEHVMVGEAVIRKYNLIDNREERRNELREKRWNKFGIDWNNKPKRPESSKAWNIRNSSIRENNRKQAERSKRSKTPFVQRNQVKVGTRTLKPEESEIFDKEGRGVINKAWSVTTRQDSPAEKMLKYRVSPKKRETFPYESRFK